MSVQLIVYPQSYDGTFNSISSSPTEFLVNGIAFSGMDSTNSYDTNTDPTGATSMITSIVNQTPIINTWQRFRTIYSGTPALPVVVAGDLILSAASALTNSGVYQKLTNLVVGQDYTVSINSASLPSGKYQYGLFNATNTLSVWATNNFSSSNFSITFTATDVSMTFALSYQNSSSSTWTINDISIQPAGGISPSGDPTILGNGQVIVDLYEDEDLPLTLSVDDFKNVAEKVQSYSKAFNLPATKRNNRIFDQVFEVTRSDDGYIFNPYKRTKCVLKQDGFILFDGYLRLLDVTNKDGEISYNVNLYSEVIALADTLQDRTFSDLDFTELEHAYDKIQIKASWNDSPTFGITYTNPSTSGFRDANSTVKYPFIDWSHQFIVANNPSGGLGPTDGNPQLPTLETAFRPFINIKYIIDRIFQATDFTYSSDFLDDVDINKLYMDFNWGNEGTGVVDGFVYASDADETVSYGSTDTTIENDTTTDGVNPDGTDIVASDFYDVSTNKFTSISDNTWVGASSILKVLSMSSNFQAVAVSIWKNGNLMMSSSQTFSVGNTFTNPFFGYFLNTGDTLEVKIKTGSGITLTLDAESSIKFYIKSYNINTNSSLLSLRGELGQWDFLKGLLTMFNLVTLPDEDNPNNIIIEPYTEVFIPTATTGTSLANRGIQYDWTDKIDVSEMKLTPLTDLNRTTMFKFVEDDEDYAFNNYKNLVGGHLYGSYKSDAGNEFNILDGEEDIVAEPFSATVVKPLMSQFPIFITPAIYSMNDDGTSEGFDNSPRIMYNNGKKSTGASYYIPPQNGLGSENQDDFLQFSHLSTIPSTSASLDFHFGECQLIDGVGVPTVNNLYGLYWSAYFNELYNPNTRTMTIKVNLTPADINAFKFNDTVMIKNRVFRVNKIDYKPNDLATVEFILIP